MLNTKDISGYLNPIAPHVEKLIAVSIPGEMNTLPAADTAAAARDAGNAGRNGR
jgi:dihydrofolate synthase/folylpolyglutamate synthase